MKAAIISSSQIGRYGRMDAGFHLAVQEVAEEAAALEAAQSAQELLARIDALETADMKPLAPLLRTSRDNGRRDDYLRAAQEYPFIAFALVRTSLAAAIQRTESVLDAKRTYLDTLRKLKGT